MVGAPDSEFEAHKPFAGYIIFAGCTSHRYKKWRFRHWPEKCGKSRKLFFFVGSKAENYFINNLLRILRLFLIAVVGRHLSACRFMFSGIYSLAQVSE